jgi:hypothetical protein
MSKQDPEEEMHEETITYVYIPYENLYGVVINHGVWASLIQYYQDGLEYTIEIPNDEFHVVDEIGIGYETGESN